MCLKQVWTGCEPALEISLSEYIVHLRWTCLKIALYIGLLPRPTPCAGPNVLMCRYRVLNIDMIWTLEDIMCVSLWDILHIEHSLSYRHWIHMSNQQTANNNWSKTGNYSGFGWWEKKWNCNHTLQSCGWLMRTESLIVWLCERERLVSDNDVAVLINEAGSTGIPHLHVLQQVGQDVSLAHDCSYATCTRPNNRPWNRWELVHSSELQLL